MEGNKGERPPSEPTRETEPTEEKEPEATRETELAKDRKPEPDRETDSAKEGKGPSWAAGSFVINLWRALRDWWTDGE